MNVQLEIYRPDRESGVLAEDLPEKALEDGMNVIIAATQGERKITAALEETRLPVVAVGTGWCCRKESPLCSTTM